jgi:hypothetical protein
MKYRIVKKNEDDYRVQYRPNWWPFWTTDSRFEWYDEPFKVQRHGGLFGNIVTEETVSSHFVKYFWSEAAAKKRIVELKKRAREQKIPTPKPEVVHTE